MAHIVVLGAGVGGVTTAFELVELRRPGDRPRFYHPLEAETWWLDGIEGDRTWPVP